jgi:hypothetical protein
VRAVRRGRRRRLRGRGGRRCRCPGLWALALGGWLALGGAAARAHAAAGEEEWQLSARAGAAALDVDGRAPIGATAGLDLEYGINDAWAARLSVGAGFHPVDADPKNHLPGGTVRTTSALLGMTYTFDVLRLVPYLQMGVGVINFGGAVVTPGTAFDAELGLGADYLLTRRWAVGGVLQYQFTPAQLFGSPMDFGGTSFYFGLAARISRLF